LETVGAAAADAGRRISRLAAVSGAGLEQATSQAPPTATGIRRELRTGTSYNGRSSRKIP
jgi:hypothetical protein